MTQRCCRPSCGCLVAARRGVVRRGKVFCCEACEKKCAPRKCVCRPCSCER